MMSRLFKYLFLSFLLTFSCQKETDAPVDDGFDRDFIHFFMKDVQYGNPSSKAIVENTEVLKALKLPLKVVDEKSVSAPFNGSVDMKWDAGSQLWPAINNRGNKVAWSEKDYSFYSWIMSAGSGAVSTSSNIKPTDKVSLTQPSTYTHDDQVWADFLMSYVVAVDGRKRPLVEFEMERITAGVEVYVSTPLNVEITIENISISSIINSADFSLVHHDMANSGRVGIRNNWLTTAKSTTSYSRSDVDVKRRTTEDMFDPKFRVMRFITIPQSVSGVLRIEYTSGGNDYVEEFDLSNVTSVRRWDRGRKTRYYINLDVSTGLQANVAEWISVDYIEGTFLPWLPDEE